MTQAFLPNKITVLPDDVVLFLPIRILFLCMFSPSFFFLDDGSVKKPQITAGRRLVAHPKELYISALSYNGKVMLGRARCF